MYNIKNTFLNRGLGVKNVCVTYALYFLSLLVSWFMPLRNTDVVVFKRVIGNGLINNYDCSRVIGHFNVFFVIVIIAVCIAVYSTNLLRGNFSNDKFQKKAWLLLDDVVGVGVVVNLFRCLQIFGPETIKFITPDTLLIFVAVLALLYYILSAYKWISLKSYCLLIITVCSFVAPLGILLIHKHVKTMITGVSIILLLNSFFVAHRYCKKINGLLNVSCCCVLLCSFPVVTAIVIELFNILAGRGIIISSPRNAYIFVSLVYFIISLLISYIVRKKEHAITKSLEHVVVPIVLVGVVLLALQLPVKMTPSYDIFESANYSVLISDFLNFGKIPIVEHYGGHMLVGVIEGIIYGVLNNDYVGAAFSPYSVYSSVFSVLVFYYVLKIVVGMPIAFLTALVFPFEAGWNYFGIGTAPFFLLIYFLNRRSYKISSLLSMSLILLCLYRLDLGFAFLIATISTVIYASIVNQDSSIAKKFTITLLVESLIVIAVWWIICVCKSINPFDRLLEFIYISASNQNWAYVGIGDSSKGVFSLVYFIVPISIEISLLFVVFKANTNKNMNPAVLLLVFLGLSYFANFSRGLVRHSLNEMALTVINWDAYLYFAVLTVVLTGKRVLLLPVFSSMIIGFGMIRNPNLVIDSTLIDKVIIRSRETHRLWTQPISFDVSKEKMTIWEKANRENKPIQRIVWNDSLKKYATPVDKALKILLADDETYIDFMNRSFLYSVLQRKDPVYAAQSPIHMSGEFTQEQFVKAIDRSNIPIVIMPLGNDNDHISANLDGILHNYRYYKVAEYLFSRYQPLCKIGECAIWSRKDSYDSLLEKLYPYFAGENKVDLALIDKNKTHSLKASWNQNNRYLKLESISVDPFIYDLERSIRLENYIGSNITIKVDCTSDTRGMMQLFYTTEKEEKYTENKSIKSEVNGHSELLFNVPVTKYTKLRLDIPERSNVIVTSLSVKPCLSFEKLNYGYDGPTLHNGQANYCKYAHMYNLVELPRIWGEKDLKKASKNKKIADLSDISGLFILPKGLNINNDKGNYMLLTCTNLGKQPIDSSIILGKLVQDKINERCRYNFRIHPGKHDYIFRVSADYYWHIGDIDAIKIPDGLINVNLQILEGD